jgi:hypothetical protein
MVTTVMSMLDHTTHGKGGREKGGKGRVSFQKGENKRNFRTTAIIEYMTTTIMILAKTTMH